ncbi:MAG: alpha-amylase family protein [Eubacteriales bacterium]|jgi:hypothetical protein
MEKLKRALHIDFHTMPGIHDFMREIDPADFAETLSDAHITLVNVFAQCNIGFSYYKTDLGIPYPGMKGDMLPDIVRECHKRGIKVVAYINVGLNHEYARKNYGNCRINSEGKVVFGDTSGNFFRAPCYNSEYGEYLLSVIREIFKKCKPDGIFCDCMFNMACWCNSCTEKMISEGIDIKNTAAVYEFQHRSMKEICRRIKDIVPPEKLCYFNGMEWTDVENSHLEIECLPSGGWGYDYFIPRSAYARMLSDNVIYMTGRFQASWGDFGGYKGLNSLENDIQDAMCQGTQFSVGDHMHPAEGLVEDIYRDIGKIYRKYEEYERWTDGCRYISEIGIIINRGSFTNSHKGAARMLSELKYGFDIIDETMDFGKYRLLLIPGDTVPNDALCEKLKDSYKNGIKLIFCGRSGVGKDGFWADFINDKAEFNGFDDTDNAYYKTNETLKDTADMPYAMYTRGILMTAKDKKDEFASRVKPYFKKHWDGLQGYFYTPPECKDGHSAVILCSDFAYVSFDPFESYFNEASSFHKKLVSELISALMPKRLIECNLPSTSRATLTGCDEYRLLHIKATYPEPRGKVNIVEEPVLLPAGQIVSVEGEYRSVKLLPGENEVMSRIKDGRTEIMLPLINGYDMFCLHK